MLEPIFERLATIGLVYRLPLMGTVVLLAGLLAMTDGRRRALHLRWAAAGLVLGAVFLIVPRLGLLRSAWPLAVLALLFPVAYALRIYGTQPFHQAPIPARPQRRPGPAREAPAGAAPDRSAPGRLAPGRSAPDRAAPDRSAQGRSTQARSAPHPPDPVPAGSLLPSRSIAEQHLYMDFNPCVCGEADWSTLKQGLVMASPKMANSYSGPCRHCGERREVLFQVLAPGAQPRDGSYGGAEPSAILDAGQFLVTSDRFAEGVPGSAKGMDPTARRRAGTALKNAIHALEEVLKFIPRNADEVPRSALRSPESAQLLRETPLQFQRARLAARLQSYSDSLKQFEIQL